MLPNDPSLTLCFLQASHSVQTAWLLEKLELPYRWQAGTGCLLGGHLWNSAKLRLSLRKGNRTSRWRLGVAGEWCCNRVRLSAPCFPTASLGLEGGMAESVFALGISAKPTARPIACSPPLPYNDPKSANKFRPSKVSFIVTAFAQSTKGLWTLLSNGGKARDWDCAHRRWRPRLPEMWTEERGRPYADMIGGPL